MHDMLSSLSTYGYVVLFLYSLGGGMVAIVAAGILSYMGKMDIGVSIVVAYLANAIGDSVLFYLARFNRAAVMPYFKNQTRKLAYAQILMKKHGDKMIFFQKYIYGVKTLVPLAIGLTKYSYIKFNILNFLAAGVWAVLLGFGSYYASDAFIKVTDYLGDNSWIMPVFMLCLLGGTWLFLENKTKKKEQK